MVFIMFGIPCTLVFYLKNKDLWETKQFEGKFGAIFDSLRTDTKFSLFYPVFFMFRRIIFAWQCICLTKNYLPTMHTQFYFSLIQIGYILMCWPFESRLITVLELMNELVMLFSLYSVFLFNKLFVTDESFIIEVGYFMMSILVLCMLVHLFFLVKTMALDFYGSM